MPFAPWADEAAAREAVGDALDCDEPDGRWQNANAALNGIRHQFGL